METRVVAGIGFTAGRWPLDPHRPTLIFLHGGGGSHELWRGQVDALAERANTVALDLPGRGLSPGSGLRTIPDQSCPTIPCARAVEYRYAEISNRAVKPFGRFWRVQSAVRYYRLESLVGELL